MIENKTEGKPDNDGFSSSDGEFDKEVEVLIVTKPVAVLRNQIRRERKEHAAEILKKDEKIEKLENDITKLEKTSIKSEELERKLTELQDRNNKLIDELDETRKRFSVYQDVGDQMKSRIEAQKEEIERLNNELSESKNDLSEHDSNSQQQSQATYSNFVSDSTESFMNKHVVPQHLSIKRHEYAKNLAFWNFDNGPLETQISNYHDSNFTGEKQFIRIYF